MTQQKFGRNYRLTVWPIDGGAEIVITPPFTVNFSCTRETYAHINNLTIDIYNLSEGIRKRIFQDINVIGQNFLNEQDPSGDTRLSFNILLEAGYGSDLSRIFYGKMLQASSAREGTNIITRISASSALSDLKGTLIQETLQASEASPITLAEVMVYLVSKFPNLKLGGIGNFPTKFIRPVALNGNTWGLLQGFSDGNVFIDDGKIYILNNNEVVPGVFVINDATGILQTPRRQQSLLTVTTLMETGVNTLGQLVQVQSSVTPDYNGVYKVLGITHNAMISPAACGRAISAFSLLANGTYGLQDSPSPVPGSGFIVVPTPTLTGA